MTDLIQESYNKLTLLPLVPASIVEYLISNNEMVFKLLYYNSPDAWNKANLTASEKRSLIYNGTGPVENYRIFLDTGQDAAMTDQISILRVSVLEFEPKNYVIGYISILIEVYCHYLVNTMDNYCVRTDSIIQSVISSLNGAEIPHTSRLYFDSSQNRRSKIFTTGTSPFRGKAAIMCSWNT